MLHDHIRMATSPGTFRLHYNLIGPVSYMRWAAGRKATWNVAVLSGLKYGGMIKYSNSKEMGVNEKHVWGEGRTGSSGKKGELGEQMWSRPTGLAYVGPKGKAFCVTEMGLLQPSTLNTQVTDLTLLILIPSVQKPGCGISVLDTVAENPTRWCYHVKQGIILLLPMRILACRCQAGCVIAKPAFQMKSSRPPRSPVNPSPVILSLLPLLPG